MMRSCGPGDLTVAISNCGSGFWANAMANAFMRNIASRDRRIFTLFLTQKMRGLSLLRSVARSVVPGNSSSRNPVVCRKRNPYVSYVTASVNGVFRLAEIVKRPEKERTDMRLEAASGDRWLNGR